MAGNNRRPSKGKHTRRPAAPEVRSLGRTMRLEQLEDRTTPAIIQNGVPDFLSAGPAPITGEGNEVVPGNFDTGAVKTIATDPADPNIAFLGGVNGGVWRTTNATAATPSWTPLTDQMPSLTVGAISLNPANPNQLLVGVGAFSSFMRIGEDLVGAMYTENALAPNPTFRVLSNNIAGMEVSAVIARNGYLLVAGQQPQTGPGPSGVFVSTDGGATFKHLNGAGGLPLASNNDVYDAVADPVSPNRVYVIGKFGIYRTDDITAAVPAWTNVTPAAFPEAAVQATTDLTQATNAKLAIHSSAAGNVVYAAVATNAPNGTSFFRVIWSTDLGTTWTPMDEATLVSNTVPISKVTDFGTNPIKITSVGHGLVTGDRVFIQGVSGNLGANGVWTVTRVDADNFTLDGSAATGNWTGGGTWQKMFGVGVGNQAEIHIAIAADPTNPNLVYVSGDRQDSFPFAGSIMRGNRSQPRTFGSTPTSPQWKPIVFSGAAGGTAPHADSRALVFDAAGNLLEGDDGGIFRRTSPQTSSGGWTSINGNLSINQITSIRLDTVNHRLFAGSQDTGANLQVSGAGPTGSQMWQQVQGGDGFWQGVDNTSTPFSSIHYMTSNTIDSLNRYVYDNTGKLVSSSAVQLASPSSPTKFESALAASDKGGATLGNNVFELNLLDPRLMMLAMTHLYEDNDPSGNAGDVIADVTPAGYAGRGTAVVYGGKQLGVSFPRIAYVGTDAGQLWIRGAADGFYQGNLPASSSGPVQGIGVDPDNWRTAYVLRGNHVYVTNDAGLSFTDITQNLLGTGVDATGNVIGGLTNALTTLTVYDPNPGTTAGGVVVLVGGQGGVFRFYPGLNDPNVTTGNWSEFGAGLPNAIVSDVRIFGNELVVGTQGRGAWVVPDVSTTITAKSIVQVMGTAGNDVMTIQADPSNPQYVIVSDGQGNVRRFQETQVQGFQVIGLGGADTAQVLASGAAGGDLHFVNYPISVDLGGDPGDTLAIRNMAAPAASFVTITGGSVGGGASDTLLGANGSITYTGLQKGSLILDLGGDAPAGNVVAVQATTAGATTILGGAKLDTVAVNSVAGDPNVGGTLDGIGGNVGFDGRGGGDQLVVSDVGATRGNANVVLGPGSITGMAGPTDASAITYANIQNLNVFGSNNPQVAEQYTVANPSAPLTLTTYDGPDTVNVRGLGQSAAINTGAGNDLIRVSSAAGVNDDGGLSQVVAPFSVDAGAGDNQLIVSNFGGPVGSTFGVSSQTITGPVALAYAATGGRFFSPLGDGILVRGSNAGNDTFNIGAALAGSQTVVDGAGGDDTLNLTAQGLAGSVVLRGGAGNDALNLNAGALGNQASSLLLSGGGQAGDVATLNGLVSADDNTNIAVTSASGGVATGLGHPINFDTLGRVVSNGLGGRNNLTFTDATGAGHGSIGDPLAGIVYAPNGETSGRVSIGNGAVGPFVDFSNVSGPDVGGLVINADPSGQRRGVITVLSASDSALGSQFGEATGPSGADDVTVSDQGVLLHNDSIGYLRAMTVAQVNGAPAASALIVRTGNETGPGDRVTVKPSSALNILVDGGRGQNALNFDSTAAATLVHTDDPTVAPFQSRYQFSDGTSFGFTNFQGGSGAQNIIAVGADVGGGPRVRVLDASTQNVLFDGFVYSPNFTGGVRVATGDVNGDGVPDLITAAGIGGGPHIQVFDGTDFAPIASFFAYEPTFTGGLYVTVGDVDGDGVDDIITGTGVGGGPLVKVFDYQGNQKDAFAAYDPNFRGGVRVGAGDINGDGASEIITGAGVGGGPQVTVFSYPTNAVIESYFATDPSYRGGIFVAAGDMDGDGKAEIAAGPGTDQAAQVVNILRSSDGSMASLNVADTGAINTAGTLPATPMVGLAGMNSPTQLTGGLRLAMIPGTDGKDQLAVARGPGFVPRVHLYSLDPLQEVGNFVPFELTFEGGIFVG